MWQMDDDMMSCWVLKMQSTGFLPSGFNKVNEKDVCDSLRDFFLCLTQEHRNSKAMTSCYLLRYLIPLFTHSHADVAGMGKRQ